MRIVGDTNIDFVRSMPFFVILSALLVLSSLALILVRGFNLSIEFKGGTVVQIKVPSEAGVVDEGRVRAILAEAEHTDASVVRVGAVDEQSFLIQLQKSEATDQELALGLVSELSAKLGAPVELQRSESIGPRVGNEMRRDAVWAIVISWTLILLYVWFRFDLRYAPGAVIALMHDTIVTAGVFALFGWEFDLEIVAALLVIIGYSLNDTIIIYDRIRENLGARGVVHLEDVVNQSLNQTLSRTILTSLTVLLVVLATLIFGGPVLRGFAAALTIGLVIGTYSTVYVATALLIYLERRFGAPVGERRGARAAT